MVMTNNSYNEEIAVQDAVSENYDSIRYVKGHSRLYQDLWYKDMVALITKKGLILDNGCGVGHLADFIPMENTIGFDISKGMIDKAKNRTSKLICGDSQRLPFKNETFDVIFCRSLLHHLPDPIEEIKEMKRVLKIDGELIISEPIQSVLNIIPRKLAKRTDHFSDVHKDFKAKELIGMLRKFFFVDDVKYFGYIAYPILGFPDVIDLYKYLPFGKNTANILIELDKHISRIPIIKTQSWGIRIKVIKKNSNALFNDKILSFKEIF